MELTNQEKNLIKRALNERIISNKKVLDNLSNIGVPVEKDKVCMEYANENVALEKLFRRFIDEE